MIAPARPKPRPVARRNGKLGVTRAHRWIAKTFFVEAAGDARDAKTSWQAWLPVVWILIVAASYFAGVISDLVRR